MPENSGACGGGKSQIPPPMLAAKPVKEAAASPACPQRSHRVGTGAEQQINLINLLQLVCKGIIPPSGVEY